MPSGAAVARHATAVPSSSTNWPGIATVRRCSDAEALAPQSLRTSLRDRAAAIVARYEEAP